MNCLTTSKNKEQKIAITNLFKLIQNEPDSKLIESQIISFLNQLLLSSEWSEIDDHINCLKYFCMNNAVVEYIRKVRIVYYF